eukprot:6323882-Alexandrium_andersonii.AAC.1
MYSYMCFATRALNYILRERLRGSLHPMVTVDCTGERQSDSHSVAPPPSQRIGIDSVTSVQGP